MYGMNWDDPPPKKKYKPWEKMKENGFKAAAKPPRNGKLAARKPKPEKTLQTKQQRSDAMKESAWRRHAPNKGSAPMQSASGSADCIVYSSGRVRPKFIEEDWDN